MAFKRLFKIGVLTLFGGIFMANSFCSAHSIRTPEGNMPMVHWAVVESTPGGMTAMGRIAQETVGPQSAREAGRGFWKSMKAMKLIAYTAPVKLFRHIGQPDCLF